jgi:hypothetical protein
MLAEEFVRFVLDINRDKKNGYYVELGSADPVDGSNTYSLEKDHGWKGVSFDMDTVQSKKFNDFRDNPCICEDATKFDYRKYFQENKFPERIDYLQVDIDSGYLPTGRPIGNPAQSLLGLIALPLNVYRFNVITFEHDASNYYKLSSVRDAQREILDSLGYSLVKRWGYEDWWIDPEIMDFQEYKHFLRMEAP